VARVIDAKYATLIGAPGDICRVLDLMSVGSPSVAIDLKFANFVVTEQPVKGADLVKALEATPRPQTPTPKRQRLR